MKLIPRHLRSDNYKFSSQKSIVDFKADLNSLFDSKWYNTSNNLTGQFSSDTEFQISKKILLAFFSGGSGGYTKLKCKLYADNDKTIVDIVVKPNPQLYVATIIPPLVALDMLYSIIFYGTNDYVVITIIIAILLLIPVGASFYGQSAKNELKNTFVETFKLTKT